MSESKPTVLMILPPHLLGELFSDAALAALHSLATVRLDQRARWTSDELATVVPGATVLVTGWGSPPITPAVLAAADALQLIAHSAGSVKRLIEPAVLARGVAVTSAASAIAEAVADLALLLVLLGLRHVVRYDRALRGGLAWAGPWHFGPTHQLAGQRIGVVGASFVGRRVVERLRPLGAEVWLSDPYLAADEAQRLGVRLVGLDELLRHCPIVTLHAPTTPETRHLLGARELALLADNAYLINTARAWLVDQEALLAELRSGRLRAALDVFESEPLAPDSPWRQLENVVLTPHIAGATVEARRQQGDTIVDEIARFLSGRPLSYGITAERLAIMA